jgi:hypothetical protein
MLIPATIPGIAPWRTDHPPLQARWVRARGYLVTALMACPLMSVLLCGVLLVMASARPGVTAWVLLPLLGAALPGAILVGSIRSMIFHPPRWARAAMLCGCHQLLLGGIPAVGFAAGDSGVGAMTVLVLQAVVVGISVYCAVRAHRALLTPLGPELGAIPFTVAFRPRFADPTMLSGSVSVGADRVDWTARRHRGRSRVSGHGSVMFAQLRGARSTVLPREPAPVPWIRLSNGEVVCTSPGPVVLLGTDTGEWMLPVNDAALFVELLNRRIDLWRTPHGLR